MSSLFSFFVAWKERRRLGREFELEDIKKEIRKTQADICLLNRFASITISEAEYMMSFFELVRYKRRKEDIRHNEAIIRSLERRRNQLQRQLGHE